MSTLKTKRIERLLPNNVPRYVRIYDNQGTSADRYTIIFSGNYAGRDGCDYIHMSDNPRHPQFGYCQHGWHRQVIDYSGYSHLGKKISFDRLPTDCKNIILTEYKQIWKLE